MNGKHRATPAIDEFHFHYADLWFDACEKWALEQQPFEIRNYRPDYDDFFSEYLCSRYKHTLRHDNTTAILTPNSSEV